MGPMHEFFRRFAHKASELVGTPWAFAIALSGVAAWLMLGHFFGYSDSWQLFINTGTTILTFLMVFLIQNTQNRDSHAVHLKLDELIKASRPARDNLIDIEDMDEAELDKYEAEFRALRQRREQKQAAGHNDPSHPRQLHL